MSDPKAGFLEAAPSVAEVRARLVKHNEEGAALRRLLRLAKAAEKLTGAKEKGVGRE